MKRSLQLFVVGLVITAAGGVFPDRLLAAESEAASRSAHPVAVGTNAAIGFLEAKIAEDPDDVAAHNMLADRYLDRLRAGGGDEDLAHAASAVQRSLASVPAEMNGAAIAVQVRIDLAAHRFEPARSGAARLIAAMPNEGSYHGLLGDALFELGRVDEAAQAFQAAERLDGQQVHTEFRFAQLATLQGLDLRALRHLQAALALAESHSPPSPEYVAWCHGQVGQYWFTKGRWKEAGLEYTAAQRLAPDDLLVLELQSELAAANGDYAAAVAGYQQIVERSPRPEFRHALGDVLVFSGRKDEAQRWYDQALAGYMKSVNAGYVHYYHHLSGFFSDSRPDGKQAVKWASLDLAMRKSAAAYDAYAWALYVDGQIDEAADASRHLLHDANKDAHQLFHAGMILSRHGDISGGAALLQRAVAANPHYNSFHVHR